MTDVLGYVRVGPSGKFCANMPDAARWLVEDNTAAEPGSTACVVVSVEYLDRLETAQRVQSFDRFVVEVNEWADGVFPNESMKDLGLSLGEEAGEVQRTITKEGHGANDRRADVDWPLERRGEVGDVMIVLAEISQKDGFDLLEACWDRLDYVRERFPALPAEPDPTEGFTEATPCGSEEPHDQHMWVDDQRYYCPGAGPTMCNGLHQASDGEKFHCEFPAFPEHSTHRCYNVSGVAAYWHDSGSAFYMEVPS